MADESRSDNASFPSEADVDAVLAEFDGDHRAAIHALLHDVAALAADYDLSVSRGYVRRDTVRIYTRLMHLERGTPMHRTKLKRLKWKAQEGKCGLCGKAMDQKGSELDRFKASDGYTVENTRLVRHECHVADQAAKGYV